MKKSGYWFAAIAMAMLALTSCGRRADSGAAVEAMAGRVWAFGQEHPGGFTVDVRTMAEPTEGIAVSYAATQGSRTRESLTRVVAHALAHDGYVGGWLDAESGLYCFDSTKLFAEDQLDEALEFARQNGQRAVYVISSGKEIRLDTLAMAA